MGQQFSDDAREPQGGSRCIVGSSPAAQPDFMPELPGQEVRQPALPGRASAVLDYALSPLGHRSGALLHRMSGGDRGVDHRPLLSSSAIANTYLFVCVTRTQQDKSPATARSSAASSGGDLPSWWS